MPQFVGVGKAAAKIAGDDEREACQRGAAGTEGAAQFSRFQALRSSPVSPSTSGLPKAI